MKNKKLRQLGKICAITLALAMPMTDVLPYVTVSTYAEGETNEGDTEGSEETEKNLTVEVESTSLTIGETTQATVKRGETEVIEEISNWSSDNGDVATVNKNGLIEAKGAGEATITATVGEDEEQQTASVNITVIKKTSNIELSVESSEDNNIDVKSVTLTATNVPDDVEGTVIFYMDKTKVGRANSGNSNEVSYQYNVSDCLKGNHSFYAVYDNNATYKESTSKLVEKSYKQSTNMNLDVVEQKGTDIKSVVVTASNLPMDASGTVTFYVNEEEKSKKDVNSGEAKWTYKDEDVLKGNYSFKAYYSGDDNYAGSSKEESKVGPYYQSQEVVFSEKTSEENPLVVTLDKENAYNKEITYDSSSTIYGKKTYTIEKQNEKSNWVELTDEEKTNTTVDEDKFTTSKSGFYRVKVNVSDTEIYKKTESDYIYIYVQDRIDLSKLANIENATLSLDEKVYDGTTDVTGTYTVPLSAVKDKFNIWTGATTDGIVEFSVSGKTDDSNVNIVDGAVVPYEKQSITIESAKIPEGKLPGAKDIPDVDVDKGVKPKTTTSLKITKRSVIIGTKGNDETEKIVKITNTYGMTTKEIVEDLEKGLAQDKSSEESTGFIGEDKNLVNEIGVTIDKEFYYEGTCSGVKVKPDLAKNKLGEKFDNYDLTVADDNNLAGLSVTNMTVDDKYIYENVNFESIETVNYESRETGKIYTDSEKKQLWIGGDNLSASKKTENNFFDGVMFTSENKAGKGEKVYSNIDYKESKEQKVYVYLTNKDVVCSQPVELTYYVDVDDPTVEFSSSKGHSMNNRVKDGISSFLQDITFGIYGKKENKANISAKVSDPDLSDNITGSGIKRCSYAVISTGETKTITAEKIKESYENGDLSFKEFTEFKNSEDGFEIKVDKDRGNYVALVYAEDNVGNATIYASNGIVVDVEKPFININLEGTSATIVDEIPYYTNDVPYTVTVNDYGDKESTTDKTADKESTTVVSGIKKYTVTVSYIKKDGTRKELTNTAKEVSKDDKYYTLDDLKDLKNTYKSEITQESNKITISVTATDQAGNESTDSKNLMIDKTKPVISSTSITSKAGAKNGYYYNDEKVTMTIEVEEENFKSDKEHLTFDVVKKNGTSGNGKYTGLSLKELESEGIISVYGIDDSEKTRSEKTYCSEDNEKYPQTYTNNRTNTITLTFTEEAEYTVTPHCTDLGGLANKEEDSKITQHFVIDRTAPAISAKYIPINPGSSEDERAYTQENVTATITIDEINFSTETNKETSFADGQMDFGATKASKLDGTVLDGKRESAINKASDATNWTSNGFKRSASLTFEGDANYIFGFTYTDLAGNSTTYYPTYFTIDKTAPTGTVSIDERPWADLVEKITFGIFKNTKYNITMTSADETAGVAKTEYYRAYSEKTLDELKAYTGWTTYEPFSVNPNEQFVIYGKITDKSGNVTYVSTDGAIADDTKPVINITNKSTARNGVFGGDVTLNIDVADPESGDTYSGLEKVWYEVHSTGNMVNNKEEVLLDNSSNRVKGNQTWNGDIVIPASQFNSNDVKVQAHAIDFSGNQYDSEVVELKIDTTAPVATITFDNNNPSNGKYYNATRTATITVKERNFNPDEVSLNITNTHGTSAVVSGWTVDSSGTSDENINTCTVAFTEDGDYTMSFSCVDLPGNQSNTVTVDEFTIDKTVPTISVSFDNNNASNGKYYNAPRTATITVVEHNFNGSEVQTAINAALQSSGITAPSVNGWSSSGDTNTATVYFGTDGDYSFTVNYTDLAGNAATVATVDSFTIDQTKPEVEIFDIENKSANNGTVAPGVKYSDVNYNSNGVELTITGCNHEKKAIDGTRTSITNGQSIKMADFEHTEDVDDIYTMHAKVTDMAGNSTEKEVVFSVNRYGSTYYFTDDTKDFLDDYYNNEEKDLTVVEINVDEIKLNGISAGHDGELTDLEKGTDYKVKASGSEVSWKQYTYTINKENFEKEGQYNITIDSTDEATNKVNNKIKNANIEFVIDKTAPSIVLSGVENGKQYKSDTRDVDISVTDNIAVGDMDVYVDDMDKATKSYKSKELVKENGKVTYTLGSSNNWQNIQVSVTDAAGNKAETELCKVLVTSNIVVQFYRNTVAVVAALVVLVGIALIILLLAKRRRDDASEN